MPATPRHKLHDYLTGSGRDDRGRSLDEVLALSNADLEYIHDYIQWLFPLPTFSRAQPQAPVLGADETEIIRKDRSAQMNLQRAQDRMLRFYRETDDWLTRFDHNHLRISRILQSLALLVGKDSARAFHEAILNLHNAAGAPVNAESLRYWTRAVA